jgi:hypothetical protein
MNTTAGSFSLLGSIVPEDAGVVKRLRKSGAVILGSLVCYLSSKWRILIADPQERPIFLNSHTLGETSPLGGPDEGVNAATRISLMLTRLGRRLGLE